MAVPREDGRTTRGMVGGCGAWLFTRHRLITASLVIYVLVDKASWFRNLANLCEVERASASLSWADERLLKAGTVIEPDLWASLHHVAQKVPGHVLNDMQRIADAKSGAARLLSSKSSPDKSSSSSSSSSSSPTGSATSSSSSGHAEYAMFFLISSLLVGCAVTHTLMMPAFEKVQQTVLLFVAGLVYSFIMEPLAKHAGAIGQSYDMWMDIDPHLLLFTMLPPLVTGDAMTIDTSIAVRVSRQCLYLAGPGVAINAFLTASFLYTYLPYEWPFLLCLATGSILCATDPVAVVGLLKELGASPTLTVQIQGESLLNDGTAIVMYTIAYRMLCGDHFDIGDVINYLVKVALYAWGLGTFIGFFFYFWVKQANKRLVANNNVIQVALTLCCAYTSFILAEGAFHISGVLATVAAALVLAHKMWPHVVSKDTMHTVWHMFEYLGNTIIFFLAGALTGKTMVRIGFSDYIHLLVIYFAVTFLRGALLFGSQPLLQRLGWENQRVSVADILVMTWGGLRGAIGLALAIQVQVDRGQGQISEENADRVLFYVSGIAALTLIVNATTCPGLIHWLGITQLAGTRKKMLQILNRQLVHEVHGEHVPKCVSDDMEELLVEIEGRISQACNPRKSGLWERIPDFSVKEHRRVSEMDDADNDEDEEELATQFLSVPQKSADQTSISMIEIWSGKAIANDISEAKTKLTELSFDDLMLLEDLPRLEFLGQEQTMMRYAIEYMTEPSLQRAVNEAFLAVVRSQYKEQLDQGHFPDYKGAETLLTTITFALSKAPYDLSDWKFLEPFIEASFEETSGQLHMVADGTNEVTKKEKLKELTCAHKITESIAFHLVIAFTILVNTVLVNVEQAVRNEDEERHTNWFVCEVVFQVLFTVEFVLKFFDLKLKFFSDLWNCFDFMLVVSGLVGIAVTVAVSHVVAANEAGATNAGMQARLIRCAQIFRAIRVVRLVRLVRFWKSIKAKLFGAHVDFEVAEHMQKTTLLVNFIHAHCRAQELMVGYFGDQGTVDSVELARCILQSQLFVYQAIIMLQDQRSLLPYDVREEVHLAQDAAQVARSLEDYVVEVYQNGVISESEARTLLHPIQEHVKEFKEMIGGLSMGKQVCSLIHDGTKPDPIPDKCPKKKKAFADESLPMIVRQIIGFELDLNPLDPTHRAAQAEDTCEDQMGPKPTFDFNKIGGAERSSNDSEPSSVLEGLQRSQSRTTPSAPSTGRHQEDGKDDAREQQEKSAKVSFDRIDEDEIAPLNNLMPDQDAASERHSDESGVTVSETEKVDGKKMKPRKVKKKKDVSKVSEGVKSPRSELTLSGPKSPRPELVSASSKVSLASTTERSTPKSRKRPDKAHRSVTWGDQQDGPVLTSAMTLGLPGDSNDLLLGKSSTGSSTSPSPPSPGSRGKHSGWRSKSTAAGSSSPTIVEGHQTITGDLFEPTEV